MICSSSEFMIRFIAIFSRTFRITTARKPSSWIVINGVIATVQPYQKNGLLMAMILVQLVFGVISYLLYQRFYKLDEKTYEDICRQLEEKGMTEK